MVGGSGHREKKMPHCILEYSNNVVDQPDLNELLLQIHEFLAGTGLFKQADIKSRAFCHDLFVVGDGARDRAFVTMNVCIFSGRDDATKAQLSQGVLQVLEQHFPKTLVERRCSITVRITDIHRDSYGKLTGYQQ
jgi:5-carboxymethyl-2-hydroxymuconate isomerase